MPPIDTSTAGRSLALDVMRGVTVALMIVVNMSLSEQLSYGQLLHARWHGLTLTDLVFPSFLFIVGAAMSYSLERAAQAGRGVAFGRVLRRAAVLFAIGMLLSAFPFSRPLTEWRVPGVLQRIALTQVIAAALLLWGGTRAAWGFAVLALAGTWAALAGLGDLTLEGNAARRLDLWLFGPERIYHGEGIPYDPEGVLGTPASVVNVLAGYGAARWLRAAPAQPLSRLVLWGGLAIAVALAWHTVMPLNKKLWTPSYVLVTIGIDLLVLALLVQLIDRRGWRHGLWPWQVFGLNPLALYVLSELANSTLWLVQVQGTSLMDWIYRHAFQPWAGDKPGSLLFALAFCAVCWLPGWWMARRGIVVRL